VKERTVSLLAFAGFFILGVAIFADFGVSWDEVSHFVYGRVMLDHVIKGVPLPQDADFIYYGPFFDTLSQIVIRLLGFSDSRQVYLAKHFLTFLFFFVAVLFFYRLCRAYFGNWIAALIACLFLVVHPRIFAESFYNPKDLPFLSSFVIACSTLQWYVERKTVWRALLHGLATAICTDIRVLGIMIPAMTLSVMAVEVWQARIQRETLIKAVLGFAGYALFAVFFTVLLWPYLWPNPVAGLVSVFERFAKYPYEFPELYFGEYVLPTQLPWHYVPVWIAITTPPVIVLLFLVGSLDLVSVVRGIVFRAKEPAIAILPYLWFAVPVIAVIVMGSTLYNGWRQLFFVYPAFVMISVRGLVRLWTLVRLITRDAIRIAATAAMIVVICVDLAAAAFFMVRAHPNENVYFSSIVGGLQGSRGRFEWDYFGVASRRILECIIESDKGSEPLYIYGCEPAHYNVGILPKADRQRLRPAGLVAVASRYMEPTGLQVKREAYYVTNLRAGMEDWTSRYPRVCSVQVDGNTIAVAVKIVPPHDPGGPR